MSADQHKVQPPSFIDTPALNNIFSQFQPSSFNNTSHSVSWVYNEFSTNVKPTSYFLLCSPEATCSKVLST